MADDRRIVAGVLWVGKNGVAWRELPAEFGPWRTAYSRYRRWRRDGLWQQITQILRRAETGNK